jgi:hypothetical protein
MLDLFLKALDEIVKWVTKFDDNRSADRRALFLDVVEPVFQQVQPVIDDYYLMFYEARNSLEKAKTKEAIGDAVAEIRNRREKMLQARIAVRSFSEEIEKHVKDKHVVAFAGRVSRFFYSTEVDRVRKMSAAETFVELCEYVLREDLEKGMLFSYIQETLRHLVEGSASIASTYSAVRLHCLCPPRYQVKDQVLQSSETKMN